MTEHVITTDDEIVKKATFVRDGDSVRIMAAEYHNPLAFRASNVKVFGDGGRPVIKPANLGSLPSYTPESQGFAPGNNRWFSGLSGKAAVIIEGHGVSVANLEITGAKNSDQNGTGIMTLTTRPGPNGPVKVGASLHAMDCYIHDNQDGIRTTAVDPSIGPTTPLPVTLPGDETMNECIWIQRCVIVRNGSDGSAHGIYIGRDLLLIVDDSDLHDAVIGHDYKVRARVAILRNSTLLDTAIGPNSSRNIDRSGGVTIGLGLQLRKGELTSNNSSLAYFYSNRDPDGPLEVYLSDLSFESPLHKAGCAIRFDMANWQGKIDWADFFFADTGDKYNMCQGQKGPLLDPTLLGPIEQFDGNTRFLPPKGIKLGSNIRIAKIGTVLPDRQRHPMRDFILTPDTAKEFVAYFRGSDAPAIPGFTVPFPDPAPAPTPAPEPVPTPVPEPIPTPAPSPEPDPTPIPSPIPDPTPAPSPEPDPTPDPVPDPDPTPAPEPIPDPVPAPQPAAFSGSLTVTFAQGIVANIEVKPAG